MKVDSIEFRDRIFDNIRTAPPDQKVFEAPKHKLLPTVTYHQLRQFLSNIDQTAIGAATTIGIHANRTPEAYLGILCALYLGKKFVPLNPAFPIDKLKNIADLSGIDLILTSESANKSSQLSSSIINVKDVFYDLISIENNSPLKASNIHSHDLVYHLFTSGSTGDPKGVPISYSNLNQYVTGISKLIDFGIGRRFSQLFDLSFDLSMHDIFVCLFNQGTLIAASDFDIMLPVAYIEKNKIDHWFSVPVLADVAVKNYEKKPTQHQLSTSLFCGEALPVSTALNFQKYFKPSHAWNLYGPTEATIAFTARKIEPLNLNLNVFTLGQAIGANQIGILLASGEVVTQFSEGIEGEFLLCGEQVFSGYLPETSADIFVNHSGQKFYRSGDLVRIKNSEICFVGRKDSQVKIRGHRIELGEIENAFRKITKQDLVVAFTTGELLQKEIIIAYQAASPIDVYNKLEELLPAYMLPKKIQHFVNLPLNANGKIDRKQLSVLCND